MDMVLSRAQIEEFKAQGVLILPGFVGEAQLESWREQLWAGGEPTPERVEACKAEGGLTPTPGELPQFQALVEQLGGGAFTGGGAQIACNFPNTAPDEWNHPGSGHVDGYNGACECKL